MTAARESWEQWVGSTTPPVQHVQAGAKVRTSTEHKVVVRGDLMGGHVTVQDRPGRKWITFTVDRDGEKVLVDMPEDAPTKSCDLGRHDRCSHRLGGSCEGGVLLKTGLNYFVWRCGCFCHNDPARVGRLF